MDVREETLGWKIFCFLLLMLPCFGAVSMLLLFISLEPTKLVVISLFLSYFIAKNQQDKEDLENKIYELKELIFATKNKTDEK